MNDHGKGRRRVYPAADRGNVFAPADKDDACHPRPIVVRLISPLAVITTTQFAPLARRIRKGGLAKAMSFSHSLGQA